MHQRCRHLLWHQLCLCSYWCLLRKRNTWCERYLVICLFQYCTALSAAVTVQYLGIPSFGSSRGWVERRLDSLSYSLGMSIKCALNSLKTEPCFGLIRISHHILPVGLYWISTAPPRQSCLKLKKSLMCLVFFKLDTILFLERRMVDLLSWRRTLWSIIWRWASIKYLSHRISGNAL